MEGFTAIDAVVAVVIVLSALLAYSRGLVREGMAIVGWIAAAVVAYMFAPQAEPLMKEIPVLDEFLSDNCEMATIAAFFGIFALALVVLSLITPVFASVVQRSALGGLDQALGFLFGVARGILLVAVAFFIYETVVTSQDIAMVEDSRSAAVFAQFTGKIEDQNPEEALSWVTQRYEALVSGCTAGATPSE